MSTDADWDVRDDDRPEFPWIWPLRGMPPMREGACGPPSSSSSVLELRAPPPSPVFSGRKSSPCCKSTYDQTLELCVQLKATALGVTSVAGRLGIFTTSSVPPPDPAAPVSIVRLVERVLWDPCSLGERFCMVALWAAQAEQSSQYWQILLKAGDAESVDRTLGALLWCIFEVMNSKCGHHLFKRLVDACGQWEAQLERLVNAVAARPGALVESARRKHGRRCVEKLLVTARSKRPLRRRLTAALSLGIPDLMMDECGHVFVDSCLRRLSAEQNEFIFAAAMRDLDRIARGKHGSPTLTSCIKHAPSGARDALVDAVISVSPSLAQDPYGNYVVQGVLDLGEDEYTERLCRELRGHGAHLAMHKNGSHVLESCVGTPAGRRHIAHDLISSGKLDLIAKDPYGNYVLQTLIKQCRQQTGHEEAPQEGEHRLVSTLEAALGPHLKQLRLHPHGRTVYKLLRQEVSS